MKKTKLALGALIVVTGMLFSFNAFQVKTIKGTVAPADKATRVWALSSSDTLNADVQNGAFEIRDVKAGNYSIIVEAQEPFANTRRKDVIVSADSAVTNVGEIKLQPKSEN